MQFYRLIPRKKSQTKGVQSTRLNPLRLGQSIGRNTFYGKRKLEGLRLDMFVVMRFLTRDCVQVLNSGINVFVDRFSMLDAKNPDFRRQQFKYNPVIANSQLPIAFK